jgi:hypothetical protein
MKKMLAALLLVVSAPSMAVTIDFGVLNVPGVVAIGNSFNQAGEYEDQFKFSINQAATAGGLILEFDLSRLLNLDVTAVSLTGTSGGLIGFDASPSTYSFAGLGVDSYTLRIFSTVTSTALTARSLGTVAYGGLLALGRSTAPTQVPEPGTLALFGLGLMGVAAAAHRRAAANR